ncbi:CBS domain-containing protein, partial [Candidatus Aerophobetes bacterium]|nr:CBS domain-containing protein [Candidatus Aerophobetes bacterium]
MQVITTHTGCDFDGLASMVAAGKLYPEAKLCLSGPPSPEVRSFLHLYGGMIPVERFDEKRLSEVERLILVDTRWASRIGIFKRLVEEKKVEIHIYDHHPAHPRDIKGEAGISMEVGATTSILVDVIKKRNIPITPFEATLFGLGIYEDTGCLCFFSTTSLDLSSMAYLLDKGARLEFISLFLNPGLTEKQSILLKDFIEKAKTVNINGVEIVLIVTRVDDFMGGLSLPLHRFIDLKNPDVVFAIVGSQDKVYVMARSRLPFVNVDEILSSLGGGGHSMAASAVLKKKEPEEVERALYSILQDTVRSPLNVKEVMRPCTRFVLPEMRAVDVKKMLEEEKLEVIPVEKEKKVVGIISKEKVENIILHNSPESLIKSYYSRRFAKIEPSSPLKKAYRKMIEEKVPWLFVFEGERCLGVITAQDIFNALSVSFWSDNLKSLLEKKVPSRIMDILVKAGEVAKKMGFSVFIVGGFVRDLLLGNENLDIDLSVEGEGVLFARELAEKLNATLSLHPEFGTATLELEEGFRLDIATTRREFYPHPGKLPVVEKASLRDDLFRRDFTVNAMAISLNPSDFGRLIDYFGGRKDLEERKVRVLHSGSFKDDPTRIFRAVRFEKRYGFFIEKNTENLIRQALRDNAFSPVSGKRIKEELVQILEEDRPDEMLERM